MRYHGNYCGPNWSAGKYQLSVVSDVEAVDEFDETCRAHDARYAMNDDLSAADVEFYNANIGQGFKRSIAAIGVRTQQFIRDLTRDKNISKQIIKPNQPTNKPKMPKQSKSLRGAKAPIAKAPRSSASLATVPAAYGFSLRMQPPTVARNGQNATITGSDFASSVYAANSSTTYEPAASVLITPTNFQSAMLGSLSRTYEKFRIKRASIQYIPQVATSTDGQLILTISESVKEPFIAGNSTTFLSRALSQGNAVATPMWKEASIELPYDDKWYTVDYMVDADLDDGIAMEVQVYTQATATETVGILLFHYEIEFKNPIYTFHSTLIPSPYGNGTVVALQDNSAVNATTDAIVMAVALTTANYGSIFRLIFMQAKSTLPTGPANWAAVSKVAMNQAATTTTVNQTLVNQTLATGSVLYATYNASGIALYTGMLEAIHGGNNGALIYQTATTAVGTWYFIASVVQIGPEIRATTQ